MNRCCKCGELNTGRWIFEKDIYGERLKRVCMSCGYSGTKDCIDKQQEQERLQSRLEKRQELE